MKTTSRGHAAKHALPILILDVEGVIAFRKENNFFELYPGIDNALAAYKDNGYMIVCLPTNVPTNTEEEYKFANLSLEMLSKQFTNNPISQILLVNLLSEARGVPIVKGKPVRSISTRPFNGMLQMLEEKLMNQGLFPAWDYSLIVGKTDLDKQFADNAGIKYIGADLWKATPEAFIEHDFKEEAAAYYTEQLKIPNFVEGLLDFLKKDKRDNENGN